MVFGSKFEDWFHRVLDFGPVSFGAGASFFEGSRLGIFWAWRLVQKIRDVK